MYGRTVEYEAEDDKVNPYIVKTRVNYIPASKRRVFSLVRNHFSKRRWK